MSDVASARRAGHVRVARTRRRRLARRDRHSLDESGARDGEAWTLEGTKDLVPDAGVAKSWSRQPETEGPMCGGGAPMPWGDIETFETMDSNASLRVE